MPFHTRAAMRQMCIAALVLLSGASAFAQRPNVPPPGSFTAPSIPGVVAAGTKIELVKDGFPRTEGPVGMPDGSVLVSGTDSIIKIDLAGNVSTFIEHSNQTNGMGYDPKGRIISVQRTRGNEKVGVLYPIGSEATLVDENEGKLTFSYDTPAV